MDPPHTSIQFKVKQLQTLLTQAHDTIQKQASEISGLKKALLLEQTPLPDGGQSVESLREDVIPNTTQESSKSPSITQEPSNSPSITQESSEPNDHYLKSYISHLEFLNQRFQHQLEQSKTTISLLKQENKQLEDCLKEFQVVQDFLEECPSCSVKVESMSKWGVAASLKRHDSMMQSQIDLDACDTESQIQVDEGGTVDACDTVDEGDTKSPSKSLPVKEAIFAQEVSHSQIYSLHQEESLEKESKKPNASIERSVYGSLKIPDPKSMPKASPPVAPASVYWESVPSLNSSVKDEIISTLQKERDELQEELIIRYSQLRQLLHKN